MVLDEVYTYIGSKQNRCYVWTALGFSARGERLAFFHVDKTSGEAGLLRFLKHLPRANRYYSDGNPAYASVLGTQVASIKGVKTNLVESLNSQLRQYVSRLRRKTKAYAKSWSALTHSLANIFIFQIIK